VRAPDFWQAGKGGALGLALSPLGWLYGLGVGARLQWSSAWRAPVPILCIGNLVAGGAGKTPVAISLQERLKKLGTEAHFLTRGYGGSAPGPVQVDDARHGAGEVGDEALLLARRATTWVSRNRPNGCRAAVQGGAKAIIMDDGFQNPSLEKSLSLVVVDGVFGFGNRRVMPAGPLREPVAQGLARADGLVIVGPDEANIRSVAVDFGDSNIPVFQTRLAAKQNGVPLAGQSVVAFAGIGRPEKFFRTLSDMGCKLAAAHAFADHHPYSASEIDVIVKEADAAGAIPVTTEKDAVRLPPAYRDRIQVLTIDVEWEDEGAIDKFLVPLLDNGN